MVNYCRPVSRKNLYYDCLQFAHVKDHEQPLQPTAVVGFYSEAGPAKDSSPIANIDPNRALISFKEMPITTVKANHDAGKVPCVEIGSLAVERAALINHFERRQNPALLRIVEFDGLICQPCLDRPHGHRSLAFLVWDSLCARDTAIEKTATRPSQRGRSRNVMTMGYTALILHHLQRR